MSLGNKETLQFIKDGAVCVEVGVWQGDLSRQIAQLPISRLYLIDPWESINDVEGRLHNTDQKNLDDIYNKAEKIIGKIETRFYYKLCDLRVIYGEMFREELRDYDYWGWGDLDVMYGNFENFPVPANGTPDLFCNYHKRDAIHLVQSDTPLGLWYASGHFVMMRNDDRSRGLINHLPTADRLIKDITNRYIDEHLVPTVLMHEFKNIKRIHSTAIQYVDPNSVVMKNGAIYADGKHLNYIHWYTDKDKIKSIENWRAVPNDFKLTDYYEC